MEVFWLGQNRLLASPIKPGLTSSALYSFKAVLFFVCKTWSFSQSNLNRSLLFVNHSENLLARITNHDLWIIAKQLLQRKWKWFGYTLRKFPGDIAKNAHKKAVEWTWKRSNFKKSWFEAKAMAPLYTFACPWTGRIIYILFLYTISGVPKRVANFPNANDKSFLSQQFYVRTNAFVDCF